MILAALLLAAAQQVSAPPPAFNPDRMIAVISEGRLEGDVVATHWTENETEDASGPEFGYFGLLPEPYRGGDDGTSWRWASLTKQIVAVMVMQQVAAGRVELDTPVARYLPDWRAPNARAITVRQLLQHQSGLANPDDTAVKPDDFPTFYRKEFSGNRDPLRGHCAGTAKSAPGGPCSCNNCDYLVLGALLERVGGKPWPQLFRETIARPAGLKQVGVYPGERWTRFGTIDGKREPAFDLASWGAAGAIWGAPDDVLRFDVALARGKLLPPTQLAELWRGVPALGYMALGQWVFEAALKGCASPVRIVERRGGIGGVEVRNFILPDHRIALAVFSQAQPFDFGEVWQGKGFSHDLLSAAAC